MTQPIYAAAGQGRRLRVWRAPNAGPNSITVSGLDTILGRARAATRNDPWAGTASDKLTSNGIGTGIQAKAVWGTPEWKKKEKKLWNRFVKACDADGVLDLYGLQALAWREWHEAGEVFVRLRRRRLDDGLPVPLQLQVIESEQCPANYYATASNGNQIRAGIEFDRIGRRVAYWMYRAHPGDVMSGASTDPTMLVRVPADQVLHLFEPLRAGQIRGIPRAASVLVRMFNLDSLDDAVLERQKIANLFAGFYTRKPSVDEDLPGMKEDMAGADGAEPDVDADGTPLAGLEPATMQELPEGWDVKFNNPPDAGQNYGEFLRGHLMAIAARHGVPYEVLTGDLRDVSDRALRLILNEFRRIVEMWQWLYMIPQFLEPIRRAYFDAAVMVGALDISGYADQRDEVTETLWVPQGWPYSHPVQDIEADKSAVRAGFISRSKVVLSNGEDPEQIDAELAEDNKRADGLGLVLDTDPRKVSNAGLTQARPKGTELPDTGAK